MPTLSKHKNIFSIVVPVLVLLFVHARAPGAAEVRPENFNGIQRLVGESDAVLLSDPNGRVLFSHNADRPLIPASALKVLTALTALHYLGPEFRFVTEFYTDRDSNLKVKGLGDPMLVSESVRDMARALSLRVGPDGKSFKDLILDHSYFDAPVTIPGVNASFEPYDAPNGALCVNFNTVFFMRNAEGHYVSAEPQTPLLPTVINRIRASGLSSGRIVLSAARNEHTFYAGQLMLYFLKQQGFEPGGKVRIGKVDSSRDTLLFRYPSGFSLEQVIENLLEYSNNFTANQLFIAAGARACGPPGTLDKGVRAATAYAKNVLKLPDVEIVEGSGISRENRITARGLVRVLDAFAPYHRLMQRDGRQYYKTGTLYGINTRAGYLEDEKGGLYRFAVLVNTPKRSIDRIMQRLLSGFENGSD